VLEPGGGTAVGAVESLLTSSCFRKGAESRRRHRVCGAPSLPIWRSEPDGTPVLFPWPESARGRVMMVPPVDVAGLRPRLGGVEAPLRSSLSPVAEVESEPLVRARRRPSAEARVESEPWVGRSRVRRLLGLSPSSSPGSGGAEFVIFRGLARVRALGRAEFAVFRGLARVRALGRAERRSPSSGA
jgi:hypothetical protein